MENPFYLDPKANNVIDCVNDPRILADIPVEKYDSNVTFPVVLTGAQQGWQFNGESTLADVHEVRDQVANNWPQVEQNDAQNVKMLEFAYTIVMIFYI